MTKILLVDDEPDMELLIKRRFRKEAEERLEFHYAANGLAALEILDHHSDIDLILSDINMPEMDGLTLLDRLSVSHPYKKTIMVSAYGDMDNIRTAMNRGAFDFIMKPINFDDLRTTIDKTIHAIENDKASRHAMEENQRLHEEFRIARNVQQKLLPHTAPVQDTYDIFAFNQPAMEIGGDYYDFIPFGESGLGVVIADVSGKGASAAFYMAEVKGILHGLSRFCPTPKAMLSEANRILYQTMEKSMFVTASVGVLRDRTLSYVRAGHCPLIHYSKGSVNTFEPKGIGLGMDKGPRFDQSLEEINIPLNSGDALIFFTDGICESTNSALEEFGQERLTAILQARGGESSAQIGQTILQEVLTFSPDPTKRDDITLIVIKVR